MLKDQVIHKASVTYKDNCSCSKFYVGQSKQNCEVRWREYFSTKKASEVGDHLLLNPGHTVNQVILTSAPKQINKRKLLEAFYIRTLQPTQNNQLNTKRTHLFRTGIT